MSALPDQNAQNRNNMSLDAADQNRTWTRRANGW